MNCSNEFTNGTFEFVKEVARRGSERGGAEYRLGVMDIMISSISGISWI